MGIPTEIKPIVAHCLKEYGIGEMESLRPILQEQLIQIEEYVQEVLKEQSEVAKKIKKVSKVNLLSIANGAKIQRSTIYNNENVLKKYIEERLSYISNEDKLQVQRIENLQKENCFLKDYLEKLRLNLVENEMMEMQFEELEFELKAIRLQVENITKENNELKFERNELKKQLYDIKPSKVVPLR